MSSTNPPIAPPPPLGLPAPKRGIRALNKWPAILGGGVVVVVSGIVLWTIFGLNDGAGGLADAGDTGQSQAGGASDILANAPSGNEIAAYRLPAVARATIANRQSTQPSAATTAPADIPDDMTETAIAARKAAWATYYAALAERDRTRLENRRKSMQADTEVDVRTEATATPASANASGQAAAAQPRDFLSQAASNPATDYLAFTVTDPLSPYELKATDQITAKLVTQLNSDSPGILKALVTKNVLDHATGNHILIPQGSTLQGVYDTTIGYGQTRTTTAWTRIIYPPPCDQSLDLGAMAGADQTGQAGFEDLTDNHLGKIFTAAILVSIFSAGVQLSQPSGNSFQSYSPVQTVGSSVGQQTSQLGQEFARKGLSIAPTEQVRSGYNFSIFLSKDIAFAHPWVAGVCGGNSVEVAAQ